VAFPLVGPSKIFCQNSIKFLKGQENKLTVIYQVVPVRRTLSARAIPGCTEMNLCNENPKIYYDINIPDERQKRLGSRYNLSQVARNRALIRATDPSFYFYNELVAPFLFDDSWTYLFCSRNVLSNALTATWEAYPIDKYNNAQTYGKTSRGGSPGGLLRFYRINASLVRRVEIISYKVPVAVDDLGSRRPAEKTKGDGQANSCDRVARNSQKNVGNEYARHGGAV
jgi:hypothetical protein